MSSSGLLRLGALAAVVGGGLFLLADLFGLGLEVTELQDGPMSSAVTSAFYVVSEVSVLIAGILLTGGLVGLYVGRSEVMGVISSPFE